MTEKKMIRKMITCFILFISILLMIFAMIEILNLFNLKQQAALIQEELSKLQNENTNLLRDIEKLNDPNYIQNYARGEYMFSKDNEKVFYLPNQDKEEGEE